MHHACVFIARRKNDCRSTRALRPSGEETVIADDASISSILSIHGARVTNIGIDGLDCDSFNHLISDMLGINAIMTRSLSTLLWNKTNGNPFHALNFLDMLLHYIATVCCVARATALGRGSRIKFCEEYEVESVRASSIICNYGMNHFWKN